MAHDLPKMTVSPQVQMAGDEFAKLVTEYCHMVDSHREISAIEFMVKMERLLAKIYLAASELPIVDLPSELIDLRFNESFNNSKSKDSDSSKFHERMKQLTSYFGKYDRYWHVVIPSDSSDHEPVEYSVAGDLSEIYDDLIDRLATWRNGSPTEKNEAFSEWQQHWDIHWGDHALNAMRAMHACIYDAIRNTASDELELRNKKI